MDVTLTSKEIALEKRKRFLKNYIRSIALYGCETWRTGSKERIRLEALECGVIGSY